jgi:hypothetical protein
LVEGKSTFVVIGGGDVALAEVVHAHESELGVLLGLGLEQKIVKEEHVALLVGTRRRRRR